MSRTLCVSVFAAVVGATAVFAPIAQAATFTESTDYSGTAASATAVGAGYDAISGTLQSGDRDFLALSLGSTSKTVSLTFSIGDNSYGNNSSYSILYSYSPFVTEWQSNTAEKDQWGNPVKYGVQTRLADATVTSSSWGGTSTYAYSIGVDPSLGSTLYLSLVSNGSANGGYVLYGINGFADPVVTSPVTSRPSTSPAASSPIADVAPVPVPAGIVLLGSAVGLGGLFGLRRKRKAA